MSHGGVHELMTGGQARSWALDVLSGGLSGEHSGAPGVTAVRHPLGFVCLPLERDGGDGVCIHVWSDTLAHAESTTSQIHCHSWDLVSHVLYGQVRNVHVRVTDAGPDATVVLSRLVDNFAQRLSLAT